MHILMLTTRGPDQTALSASERVRGQAGALARHGHTVTLVELCPDGEGAVRVERRGKDRPTEYALHYRKSLFRWERRRLLRALKDLVRTQLRNSRPDVLHVHSLGALGYARALQRRFRIPFVVTEREMVPGTGRISEKKLRSISAQLPYAGAMIVPSVGLKEQLQPLCPSEILVIPDSVDERFFLSPLHRAAQESFGFVSVGRPGSDAGLEVVLSAFSYAAAFCPGITLTIAGAGEGRRGLERQAAKLGAADKVRFTSLGSPEELAALLWEHQALVLGSRSDPLGAVAAEALACGLPVAMTRTEAWREIITVQTGLAVVSDDAHALGGAMVRLAQHNEDYDAAEIREYARSHFSEAEVCLRLTEVYRDAAER